MKRILLLSLFLLLFTACSATSMGGKNSAVSEKATEMSSLKNALDAYTYATMNHDVNRLLGFVYPKVFTLISKKKMHQVLTRMYANKKAPTIKDIAYERISSILPYDKGLYSIIDSKMTTELKSPVVDNDKFERLLFDKLKSQLGSDAEITYDKVKHIFTINKRSKIIGIKELDDGWKFVGYEQAKKYESKKVIPESIMRNLN